MTLAGLGTVSSPVSRRTRLRTIKACPARQAVAGPIGRVAGGVVGTLAGYAALPIAAGLAGSLAGGASESRGTDAVAVLRNAGAPVLAGAGVGAVYSPEALRTRQVATCSCPASLAVALSIKWVTAVGVITVTAVDTAFTKLSIRTVLVAVGPLPSRGAGTSSSLGAAGCSIGTLAGGITPKAPGPRQAGLRAASRLPTFLADAGPVDR